MIRNIVNNKINKSKDIIETFHKYYISSLSDLLSIIPLIIIKVRSKSISYFKGLRKDSSKKYYTKANKKRKMRIIKLSILISILDFLALYINVTYNIIITAAKFVINYLYSKYY